MSFIAEERAVKTEVNNSCLGLIVVLFEQLEIVEIRREIQEHVLKFVKHDNWRVRDTAVFMYQYCNYNYFRELNVKQSTIDLAVELMHDENIYVMKRARSLLEKALVRSPNRIPELMKTYKSKATEELKALKSIKSKNGDTKESLERLTTYGSILLAICYTSEYQITS